MKIEKQLFGGPEHVRQLQHLDRGQWQGSEHQHEPHGGGGYTGAEQSPQRYCFPFVVGCAFFFFFATMSE